jgi:hypothetical protein
LDSNNYSYLKGTSLSGFWLTLFGLTEDDMLPDNITADEELFYTIQDAIKKYTPET